MPLLFSLSEEYHCYYMMWFWLMRSSSCSETAQNGLVEELDSIFALIWCLLYCTLFSELFGSIFCQKKELFHLFFEEKRIYVVYFFWQCIVLS